jgi:hypothetical protein
MFLLGPGLCYLKSRMRGFHDQLREKLSSLLMLGWSSVFVASLMIRSMYLVLIRQDAGVV